MANENTKLTKNADGTYHYAPNGKARAGFVSINGKPYVFDSNGNGITRTVKLGKTYYYFEKGATNATVDGLGVGYALWKDRIESKAAKGNMGTL